MLTVKGSSKHAPAESRRLMSAGPMLLLVSLCKARNGLTSAARSRIWPFAAQQPGESRLSGVQNRRPDLLEEIWRCNRLLTA